MRRNIASWGTLAVLLLAPAAGIVWAAETEKQAIAAIEKLGGTISRDEEAPGQPVVEVNFRSSRVTDAGLVHLKVLGQLRKLLLDDTKVTDAGMVHLKELKELRTLDISDTGVTDAGLAHLKGLKQ